MSMFLLTTAFGAALGTALSSVSVDPKLVWMYTGIAISAFIAGIIFWFLFRHFNAQEDKMDAMDSKDPQKTVNASEVGQHRRDVDVGARKILRMSRGTTERGQHQRARQRQRRAPLDPGRLHPPTRIIVDHGTSDLDVSGFSAEA